MLNNYRAVKNTNAFNQTVQNLRRFFLGKGFVECHTQDRLSILAACEDPKTVATFEYAGETWPLPQTGQMWLEYELLTQPDVPGVFTLSTSYRNEPNPIPGRHEIIFPMFEFESRGNVEDLKQLETELCQHLGFGTPNDFAYKTYDELAQHYDVAELQSQHENQMTADFSPVTFIQHFPQTTSPFWNMKKEGNYAHKIDVILYGQETIGSAERSTNTEEMHDQFHTISDGQYAQLLFKLFGQKRVEQELEEFLSLDFFPRFGGGIGITRLLAAVAETQQTVSPKQAA